MTVAREACNTAEKSMTKRIRADFYLLSSATPEERLLFACRIMEKAYQQSHSLYAHTTSENEAKQLNELLWTYRDISFVPHALAVEKLNTPTPIIIGYHHDHHKHSLQDNHAAILLVLTTELPDFFKNFSRIIEIIPNETDIKAAGRQHYRVLQQHNVEIHTHKM